MSFLMGSICADISALLILLANDLNRCNCTVGLWARSRLQCQRSKVQNHVKSSVPSIPVPSRRFSHVHIDIVGPLPSSLGYSYLLTMIDRTTRWPEAVPLASISTESCVRAFISSWVSRFGVPSTLTSDRGAQFTSSVWTGVCRVLLHRGTWVSQQHHRLDD